MKFVTRAPESVSVVRVMVVHVAINVSRASMAIQIAFRVTVPHPVVSPLCVTPLVAAHACQILEAVNVLRAKPDTTNTLNVRPVIVTRTVPLVFRATLMVSASVHLISVVSSVTNVRKASTTTRHARNVIVIRPV